jgi:hypothetical protein
MVVESLTPRPRDILYQFKFCGPADSKSLKNLYSNVEGKLFITSGVGDREKSAGRQRGVTRISDKACVIT